MIGAFIGKQRPRTQMALHRMGQAASNVITSFGSSFVFRPGAQTSGNVYGTWAELVQAAASQQGTKEVYFDDSVDECEIPAGTWDLGSYTRLVGRSKGLESAPCECQLVDGARLVNVFEFEALAIVSKSDAPVIRTSDYGGDGEVVFRLAKGSSLTTAGAAPFFVTDGGPFTGTWWVADDSRLVEGTEPVLRAQGRGTTLHVIAADVGVVEDNTLHGLPNTTVIGQMASVEASISFTQVSQPNAMPGIRVLEGNGSPEGVAMGMAGDMYVDRLGGAGATFWVKESGNFTDTGWVRK
jgi:hypothetical protein